MSSLFSRLYKYAWSVKKHSRENYLTEIFAFTIQNNSLFLSSFLGRIDCHVSREEISITTQPRDSQTEIPDIVLRIGSDTLVIVEVKVDSGEGKEQLKRYSDYLLDKDRPHKHLVYLTKKSEIKELNVQGFHFCHLRWFEVYKMLERFGDTLSNEFKDYLTEQGMSRKVDFHLAQSSAIADYLRFTECVTSFLADYKDNLVKNGVTDFTDKSNYQKGEIGVSITEFSFPIWCGFYQHMNEVKLGISLDNLPVEDSRFKKIEAEFDRMDNVDSYRVSLKGKEYVTFFTQYPFSSFFKEERFDESGAMKLLVADTLRFKSIISKKENGR